MHNCPESSASVEDTAKGEDLEGIKDLFLQIGLRDLDAKKALLGWRRLGRKVGDNARPLLLMQTGYMSTSDIGVFP